MKQIIGMHFDDRDTVIEKLVVACENALHRIETDIESYPKDIELINQLKNAIKKATG